MRTGSSSASSRSLSPCAPFFLPDFFVCVSSFPYTLPSCCSSSLLEEGFVCSQHVTYPSQGVEENSQLLQ